MDLSHLKLISELYKTVWINLFLYKIVWIILVQTEYSNSMPDKDVRCLSNFIVRSLPKHGVGTITSVDATNPLSHISSSIAKVLCLPSSSRLGTVDLFSAVGLLVLCPSS